MKIVSPPRYYDTAAGPPAGVTPRTDALLRLGQAALELGTDAQALNLHIHNIPRQAFDAFPGDLRCGDGYDAKTVHLDDDGLVTILMFTAEPAPPTKPDWFEIAKRITRTGT